MPGNCNCGVRGPAVRIQRSDAAFLANCTTTTDILDLSTSTTRITTRVCRTCTGRFTIANTTCRGQVLGNTTRRCRPCRPVPPPTTEEPDFMPPAEICPPCARCIPPTTEEPITTMLTTRTPIDVVKCPPPPPLCSVFLCPGLEVVDPISTIRITTTTTRQPIEQTTTTTTTRRIAPPCPPCPTYKQLFPPNLDICPRSGTTRICGTTTTLPPPTTTTTTTIPIPLRIASQRNAVPTAVAPISQLIRKSPAIEAPAKQKEVAIALKSRDNEKNYSHSEGFNTSATAKAAHAEGEESIASARAAHAEGYDTVANSSYAHSEGNDTAASGIAAHSEGQNTSASGRAAHAEGSETLAQGTFAHAEGEDSQALASAAHAEGKGASAKGIASHSEGINTKAFSKAAHSEGTNSVAQGESSHAEGQNTFAEGSASHAEGYNTAANGLHSHSEGFETIALGNYSHSSGLGTIAATEGSTSLGRYNLTNTSQDENILFVVGRGSGNNSRDDAFWVDSSGNSFIRKRLFGSITHFTFGHDAAISSNTILKVTGGSVLGYPIPEEMILHSINIITESANSSSFHILKKLETNQSTTSQIVASITLNNAKTHNQDLNPIYFEKNSIVSVEIDPSPADVFISTSVILSFKNMSWDLFQKYQPDPNGLNLRT